MPCLPDAGPIATIVSDSGDHQQEIMSEVAAEPKTSPATIPPTAAIQMTIVEDQN
jgi:hypothetical protein